MPADIRTNPKPKDKFIAVSLIAASAGSVGSVSSSVSENNRISCMQAYLTMRGSAKRISASERGQSVSMTSTTGVLYTARCDMTGRTQDNCQCATTLTQDNIFLAGNRPDVLCVHNVKTSGRPKSVSAGPAYLDSFLTYNLLTTKPLP